MRKTGRGTLEIAYFRSMPFFGPIIQALKLKDFQGHTFNFQGHHAPVEPRFNERRYNEILVIANTIEKPKRKIYPDITNKCHHATEDECETDQQR